MAIEFSNELVVGTVAVSITRNITASDVESIMVGAIEGGINYWGYVLPESKKDKPADEPTSTWVTQLLLSGVNVYFGDVEDDDERFTLDKDKLFKGIQMHFDKGLADIDSYDADDYDCIIQRALFGQVVYG